MPEESTFRKYACLKLKLSRLLLDNLFRILVRNCAKLEFRKSGIGQFCTKWLLRMIAQIIVFSRKTDAQRKKNFAFCSAKIAQKFCEWKPYLGTTCELKIIVLWRVIINCLQQGKYIYYKLKCPAFLVDFWK